MPLTETVHANGVDITVERRGTGDPIVLVHGWTGSRGGWRRVVDGLAKSHTAIAYDHRGHGASTNTGDQSSYTIDQLLTDFEVVADALGFDSFHLLGHSLGGLVVQRYALAHPERVRSLVLVDTGASPTPGADAFMNPLIEIVQTGGLDAYYAAGAPYVGPPGPEGEGARAMFRADLDGLDPAAFVNLARELLVYPPLLDRLPELRVPTTVIVGENDVSLLSAADDLVAAIKDAVLEVIPGAGHSPHVDNPDAWLAALERHFARVEA